MKITHIRGEAFPRYIDNEFGIHKSPHKVQGPHDRKMCGEIQGSPVPTTRPEDALRVTTPATQREYETPQELTPAFPYCKPDTWHGKNLPAPAVRKRHHKPKHRR